MNNSSSNIKDIIARLPDSSDEDEIRITGLLEKELLKTDWAKDLFSTMKDLQIDFLRTAIKLDDPEQVYKNNQDLLRKLSDLSKSRIVQGGENLRNLSKPLFIVSNHLGDYKMATIKPQELDLDSTKDIHPFPMYYSSYIPVARELNANISAAHVALLEPLLTVEKSSGLVTIVVKTDGNTLSILEEDTKTLFDKHPDSAMVVFPEGGTTGKRNGKGPYDLEEFKAGAFVIAGHLGIPVLPVAKYFNPEKGYELAVFPSMKLERSDDRSYYKTFALETQNKMQAWLDTKKSS